MKKGVYGTNIPPEEGRDEVSPEQRTTDSPEEILKESEHEDQGGGGTSGSATPDEAAPEKPGGPKARD